MPRDAYSVMGGLAEMAGDYLDERGLQPPPQPKGGGGGGLIP